MPSACDRVLCTPELVQFILLCLPVADLLLFQRVSRYFQAVIASSPALQAALYFRPSSTPSSALSTFNEGDTGLPGQAYRPSPLLRENFALFFTLPESNFRSLWSRDALSNLPWDRKANAYVHPDASWRRMLVAQPPIERVEVLRIVHAQMGDFLERAELRTKDGLCMGTLYDIIDEHAARVDKRFAVDWSGARMQEHIDLRRSTRVGGEREKAKEIAAEEASRSPDWMPVLHARTLTLILHSTQSCVQQKRPKWGDRFRSLGFSEHKLSWERIKSGAWRWGGINRTPLREREVEGTPT